MGLFDRLFSRKREGSAPKPGAKTSGPVTVHRDGVEVIRVADIHLIRQRGLVVNGSVLVPVRRGDTFDVSHEGQSYVCELQHLTVDEREVTEATAGTTAALLLHGSGPLGSSWISAMTN